MADFYTFITDINRALSSGSPVSYRYDPTAFTTDPLGVSGDMEQGEMCAWDVTNQRVLRLQRAGGNGKYIGVSRDSARGMKKLGNQPGLALTELSVFTSGVHALLGTVGQTYTHGNPVYMSGTDTTRVTKTQGSNGIQVGIVENPLFQSYVGAVRVPVLIDAFTITQI